MKTPFKKLLHRFQNNLATDEERHKLMEMIKSGQYDEVIGDEWGELLIENLESDHSEEVASIREVQAIRNRIHLVGKVSSDKSKIRKFIFWSSAAAAVGILLIVAVYWNREVPQEGITLPELTHSDFTHEIDDDRIYSGRQFVKLPDGSTVILNEKSELRYKSSFGQPIREVYLSGEAYFDIVHHPDAPFVVRTGNINTRVLGTAFNVEAWPDQSRVEVTVTRGKVSVGDDQRVFEELIPNEQLSINTDTEEFEKTTLDAEVATEWKRSFFVLDRVAMENAARQISERYNVEVFIENKGLKNCLVNGAFLENESVEHVISVICLAMNAQYSIEDDIVRIIGGIGCE